MQRSPLSRYVSDQPSWKIWAWFYWVIQTTWSAAVDPECYERWGSGGGGGGGGMGEFVNRRWSLLSGSLPLSRRFWKFWLRSKAFRQHFWNLIVEIATPSTPCWIRPCHFVHEFLRMPNHSNKSYWAIFYCGASCYALQGGFTFCVRGWLILKCGHSNVCHSVVHFWDTIYSVIWVCGRKPKVWSFKVTLLRSTSVQVDAGFNFKSVLKLREQDSF